MERVRVNAGKSYDVIVEAGALKKAGEYIAKAIKTKRVAVITDDIVDSLYGSDFIDNLKESGFDPVKFVFENGEKSKNGKTYLDILNFLAEAHITRADAVIALGGGVVGDISGFAAATYLRGVEYIQVPTTLLSAVDSSVGGKCAIDLEMGKNLAGAFHQPSLVICDYNTLDTLPREVLLDGCGEVLKYGILYSEKLFAHLLENGLKFDREYIISECVRLKADVVAKDEFDTGLRAFLNLGHTTAHAIEKLSSFGVSHGSAVATGCAVAAKASAARGICSIETAKAVCDAVVTMGHKAETEYSAEDICRVMLSDKKRHGDTVDFIVVKSIGECEILPVSINELNDFVEAGLKEV